MTRATRPYVRMFSAADVRATADRLGTYFFSPDTMRFFNSRLLDVCELATPVTRTSGGIDWTDEEVVYIVTSERYAPLHGDPEPRRYTVRRVVLTRKHDERGPYDVIEIDSYNATPEGVEEGEGFQAYLPARAAKAAAQRAAARELAGKVAAR